MLSLAKAALGGHPFDACEDLDPVAQPQLFEAICSRRRGSDGSPGAAIRLLARNAARSGRGRPQIFGVPQLNGPMASHQRPTFNVADAPVGPVAQLVGVLEGPDPPSLAPISQTRRAAAA